MTVIDNIGTTIACNTDGNPNFTINLNLTLNLTINGRSIAVPTGSQNTTGPDENRAAPDDTSTAMTVATDDTSRTMTVATDENNRTITAAADENNRTVTSAAGESNRTGTAAADESNRRITSAADESNRTITSAADDETNRTITSAADENNRTVTSAAGESNRTGTAPPDASSGPVIAVTDESNRTRPDAAAEENIRTMRAASDENNRTISTFDNKTNRTITVATDDNSSTMAVIDNEGQSTKTTPDRDDQKVTAPVENNTTRAIADENNKTKGAAIESNTTRAADTMNRKRSAADDINTLIALLDESNEARIVADQIEILLASPCVHNDHLPTLALLSDRIRKRDSHDCKKVSLLSLPHEDHQNLQEKSTNTSVERSRVASTADENNKTATAADENNKTATAADENRRAATAADKITAGFEDGKVSTTAYDQKRKRKTKSALPEKQWFKKGHREKRSGRKNVYVCLPVLPFEEESDNAFSAVCDEERGATAAAVTEDTSPIPKSFKNRKNGAPLFREVRAVEASDPDAQVMPASTSHSVCKDKNVPLPAFIFTYVTPFELELGWMNPVDSVVSFCCVCKEYARGVNFRRSCCDFCKRFFNRTIKNREIFKCVTGEEACPVVGPSRGYCHFCRFRRCLMVGMWPSNLNLDSRFFVNQPTPFRTNLSDASMSNDAMKKSVCDDELQYPIIDQRNEQKENRADTKADTTVDTQADTQADTQGDIKEDTQGDTQGDTQADTQVDTQEDTKADTQVDTQGDT